MQLEGAWVTMLALGFILASGLLTWLFRYPLALQWRSYSFVATQALLVIAGGLTQNSQESLMPFLCVLSLLALSEQMRFLCQPQAHDKKLMLSLQGLLASTALSALFLPPYPAFILSFVLGCLTLAGLVFLLISKNIFYRIHLRLLLACTLFIVTGNSLLLAKSYWSVDSIVLHILALTCIALSVFVGQCAIYQFTRPASPAAPPEPTANPNNNDEHQLMLLTLSHDIRTPLSGILGMAELLLETPLSPAQQEYAQTIQSSGNALLHLVNDRLDATNAQDQSPTILEEVLDVAELLNYCLDQFKSKADNKSIELIGYLDSTLPKQVLGDAVRLRQVLSRLIHNAIRFTHTGEVVVSIKSIIYQHELCIHFSVQDTGIGLNEQQLATLFVPRQREELSLALHTGPDIAVCSQLVAAMTGKLQFDSTVHEGTMAWFILPLKTPNSVFSDSTTEFIASFAAKRLLVVDDNRTVSRVLAEQATQWGMRVSSAESGTEALAVARNAANLGQAFDVIVMDYQMPGMSGLQLGARLKEDSLITNDVILIMLTGLRQNNIQTLARNAGIHRVISKPVTSKQLRQAISQELKRLAGVPHPELNAKDSQLGRIRVLIAEDNQLSQKVVRGMMQKLGVNHTIVNNGREAVQAVMHEKFDIVLMDCDMPFVDGYTATQEIRRWEKQEHRQPMPILALTAHILEEQKQKALNSGMNEHLSKPIELGDLQSALLKWS